MELDRRAEIRRALDQLKPWLEAYVAQAIGAAALEQLMADPRRHGRPADIQKLLGVVFDKWEPLFRQRLRPVVRSYLREVNDFRNRWAHDESFSLDDVERARSTIRLVAEALGAPPRVNVAPNETETVPRSVSHRSDGVRNTQRSVPQLTSRRGDASATNKRVAEAAASYHSTRLLFKAVVLEALEPAQCFQVITPPGTFEMTKADFYRVFPNVVRSRSYREAGVYHYPKVPVAALEFLQPAPSSKRRDTA